MDAVRNVIILKWWELGLAQTQDGGCVKEQMAGPMYKMAAVRNVRILKWREIVSLGGGVKKQMAVPSV
jgi:hypothetical protein